MTQPLSNEMISEVRRVVKEITGKSETTPHNWPEFVWCVSKALGWATMSVLTVVCIVGVIAYKTLPNWVDSTVAVQKSLTENLEQQTKNIVAQTANIEAQTEAIVEVKQAVMGVAKSTEMRDSSWEQFSKDVNEVHQKQLETQTKIVEKLDDILRIEILSSPTPEPE